jgi:hypothetical protein
MWIKDQDEELINLQHITFIRCIHLPKSSKVIAIDTNEYELTLFHGSAKSVDAYMEWLSKLVQAQEIKP